MKIITIFFLTTLSFNCFSSDAETDKKHQAQEPYLCYYEGKEFSPGSTVIMPYKGKTRTNLCTYGYFDVGNSSGDNKANVLGAFWVVAE